MLCGPSMFFQSKKKSLWKRLWRARVISPNSPNYYQQEPCETAGSSLSALRNCCSFSSNSCQDLSPDQHIRHFRALVVKLKDRQLETLLQAIGGISTEGSCINNNQHQVEPPKQVHTDCVLVPRTLRQETGEEPHVIACKIWRWPDLNGASDIKRIPTCPNAGDPYYICCNPMHWSRMDNTETPPPPNYYYQFSMDRLKTEENSMSQDGFGGCRRTGSLTTDGEEAPSARGWCQLAYWELTSRVGRLFPVEDTAVNIFSEQPRGDGLDISVLVQQKHTTTPDSVLKARQKIGLGVTLSQELDGVWLYNRSSSSVFVHSPTLCDLDTRALSVSKVPPGHCLRAFDPIKAATESFKWPSQIAGAQIGPVDTHSVRISFAKGWGKNYSRQEVTACPCWLEVLLSPCR